MRPEHLEAWVLSLFDQVTAGAKVEDSRVELKADWPDARAAARRIAGHANASGGDVVLWVIGLDERRGVCPINPKEFANWYSQVSAEFDGIVPSVIDLVVATHKGTLTALLFDASRRPYLVKNPVHGSPGGGPVSLEVPWRSGTAVRSARREDLVRILVPLQALPLVELLSATASARRNEPLHRQYGPLPEQTSEHIAWNLDLTLYVTPRTSDILVLPVHKSSMRFRQGDSEAIVTSRVRFRAPSRHSSAGYVADSDTVASTSGEAIINGPGKLHVHGSHYEPLRPLPPDEPLEITLSATPADSDRTIEIKAVLVPSKSPKQEDRAWTCQIDFSPTPQ